MKRFRLSTLMLLIVISALSLALVIQERRAARREAELQLRFALMEQMRAQPVIYETQPMEIEWDGSQALANPKGRELK